MKKISEFLSENFQSLVVKFSIYLNRRVFIMKAEYHAPSLFFENGMGDKKYSVIPRRDYVATFLLKFINEPFRSLIYIYKMSL